MFAKIPVGEQLPAANGDNGIASVLHICSESEDTSDVHIRQRKSAKGDGLASHQSAGEPLEQRWRDSTGGDNNAFALASSHSAAEPIQRAAMAVGNFMEPADLAWLIERPTSVLGVSSPVVSHEGVCPVYMHSCAAALTLICTPELMPLRPPYEEF
jgi:hypothetical protein